MMDDLLTTRRRLAAGDTHAQDEISRSIDAARSDACAHAFLENLV